MRRFLLIAVVMMATHGGFAQAVDSIVAYYNLNGMPVGASEAVYIRTVTKTGDEFLVKDFYANTKALKMEAVCKTFTPELYFTGKATWYTRDGSIRKDGRYENNKPVGLFKEYYGSGKPYSEIIYAADKELHCQRWSPDGTPYLKNGSGLIKTPKVVGGLAWEVVEIVDSLLISSYTISLDKDTVYFIAEHAAEYPGGFQKLGKDLGRSLVYPKSARKMGIEGKVLITFIVDKDGTAKDIALFAGLHPELDQEALQAVRSLGRWIPARHKGKAVKSRFIQPVSFKLN